MTASTARKGFPERRENRASGALVHALWVRLNPLEHDAHNLVVAEPFNGRAQNVEIGEAVNKSHHIVCSGDVLNTANESELLFG